jgi:hypothetical protein
MTVMLDKGIEYINNGNQSIVLSFYTDSDKEERTVSILNKDIVVYKQEVVVGDQYQT